MLERIGLYRLDSPLGRGGMGEVFLAWDERLERRVAIKRIRHDDAALPVHLRDRFRREARMAARLSHAAIVQVHELVTDGDADAIVMEYVEGDTLAGRLAAGPLETEEALHLARQIAEGLAAAHEAGLIHRDLKAENVVVTPSGQAKILDFGLARPLIRDNEPLITQDGAIVGTCHAMSPEQASGEELDERTDLFSFGVLLYQMLTGRLPFRGKNPLSTLKLVLNQEPAPLLDVRPDLPPELSGLVEQLLAKDRNQRPQSAFVVARKLERLEQGFSRADESVSELPTHPYPVVPGIRTLKRGRRPRRLAALAGALVVIVIVAVTWLLAPPYMRWFNVRNSDYQEYLAIQQSINSGQTPLDEELEKLDRIVRSSPRFLEARARAVTVACKQFESTRDPGDLEQARSYLDGARKLDQNHPLTLEAAFALAMVERNQAEAKKALHRLEDVAPEAPCLPWLRYKLAYSQKLFQDAERHLKAAIDLDPSWNNVYWLADLEIRRGQIGKAHRLLGILIRHYPDNTYIKEKLGYLELIYFDLEKAEQIYRELAASSPKRAHFTNLGLARALQGHDLAAREAYSHALEMEPENPTVMLNMADTEWGLGNTVIAKDGYNQTLLRLAEISRGSELSPQDEMIKAQCLVHLGRFEQAKESVQRALRESDDAQVYRGASLVYSVAGDLDTALAYAKAALERGLLPRWFEVSAFAQLHRDIRFQSLLKS